MEKPSYFAVIPASVRYDKRLKPIERLLFGEITCLTNKDGYCFASSSYFAELYDTQRETISRYISNLAKYGYIKIEIDNGCQRKIFLDGGVTKVSQGVTELSQGVIESSQGCDQTITGGCDQTITQNNTSINNLINNKKEEVEEEKKPEKYQPILEAWNNLPVTNIRIISGKRLQMLKARIKQYSFDDVLKAIQTIHNSPFLLGDNKRKWQITFDWFVLPNNFPKVLEGNYLPKENEPAPAESIFDKVIADNQNKPGEDILFMDIVRAYKDAKANGETRTLQEYAEEYRQRKRGELNGIGTAKGVV